MKIETAAMITSYIDMNSARTALDDADLERFSKLGVNSGVELSELAPIILGKERSAKMYRCKTLWKSGALVTWSSDNVTYGDFIWNYTPDK